MTSEVAVMNRTGIALATDSAATVRSPTGKAKLYQADKLFMLSNTQPVGAMVYSNAALLGVPWEVILKLFRSKLGDTKLPNLEDYATRLWEFISDSKQLFPKAEQERYYLHLVDLLFRRLATKAGALFIAHTQDLDIEKKKPLLHFQREVALAELAIWQGKTDSGTFDMATANAYSGLASRAVNDLVVKHFPGTNDEVVNALTELSKLIITKDEIPPDARSGIVIAGYGTENVFPVMQEFQIGEIYKGKLKYRHVHTWRISNEERSVVKPFAQSEMAQTFLYGISPRVELKQVREIVEAVVYAPNAAIDGFPGVSKRRKDAYKAQILAGSIEAAKVIQKNIRDHSIKEHYSQVSQFVTYLPKNELAHVASSLVNLNSFQKRMNFRDDETVGGPIDVAVISKCDGFVWVARKHYFTPELNSHYFRNRMQPAPDTAAEETPMEVPTNEAKG
ncbi:MAG: hypothetical protein U1E04_03445 [Hylemonella sp.]|nr:hypothetical protein [Hylemonella sp.]